ncbi:MAG: hypothetical protein KGH75_01405 [Rhodospirillales bacterium]|nr:hypothetical protein [Rhodospirillales bacterium]
MELFYPLDKDSDGTIIVSGGPMDTAPQMTWSVVASLAQASWRKDFGFQPKS